MDFGFNIPPRGPMATPEGIATLAKQGEAMGFGTIAVTDHIIFPTSIQSAYPGSSGGQYYADFSARQITSGFALYEHLT